MKAEPIELEGTWEEIVTHAEELAGRRVRVIVLPSEEKKSEGQDEKESTANSLVKHIGTWAGDDFEERLRDVYETRGQAKF